MRCKPDQSFLGRDGSSWLGGDELAEGPQREELE
jgi:hypothetical protein